MSLPLTQLDDKERLYFSERTFVEFYLFLLESLGDCFDDCIFNLLPILIKPDTIVHRDGRDLVRAVATRRMRPIFCCTIDLIDNQISEIWKYQWNAATSQRIKLTTSILMTTRAVLVLYVRNRNIARYPVTVEFKPFKGHSNPSLREFHSLRAMLKCENGILSRFHCCDESIDVIRDLSLLISKQSWPTLVASVLDGVRRTDKNLESTVERTIADVEYTSPEHHLNLERSIESLAAQAKDGSRCFAASIDKGPRFNERREIMWTSFVKYCDNQAIDSNCWDAMCVGSYIVPEDRTGCAPVIDDDGQSEWLKYLG